MISLASVRNAAFLLFAVLVLLLMLPPAGAVAHEAWVLPPQQQAELSAKPLPPIFTHLNAVNVSMYLGTLVFLLGWISLNYTGARELFPDLQVRLASYGGYASLGLRIALFILLGMAGTGLGPRAGTALFEAPTLAAPDLDLRLLGPGWGWIAWLEIILAICFLLGIYVRAAAAVLLGLGILGLFTFGPRMLDYLGLIGGAGVYLLLQGAGSYFVPAPSIPGTAKILAWLANQPRLRAQFLLQLLAGFNLAYLGIYWKGYQANSMLAILQIHHVPTFGIQPPTFVLWMALVEGLSGALIMAGVLMRPLSILLLGSFFFFSAILGESVFGHIIFYGLLVSFITNGDGRWRRPVAQDKPGRIVILGGSLAGVHCAMRLERLLGDYTNVTVTLVHRESILLFQPLLPEVIGGAVQPGSIINTIRRLCPRTRLILGEVTAIDAPARQVHVNGLSGEKLTVEYDQLVLAPDPEVSFAGVPGLLEHALPVMTVGDALFLRQQVLERMEEAEIVSDARKRQALLTFSVIGGNLRGAATAAEIRALINGALVSYPAIARNEPRVLLFEEQSELLPEFPPAMASAARHRLQKLGVEIFSGTRVAAATPEDVVLPSGQRIPCRTVVSALWTRSRVVSALPWARSDGRLPVDRFLRVQGADRVLAIGECAATGIAAPFLTRREIRMGRRGAYNALALHRRYKLLPWSDRKPRLAVAALGRHATIASFFGIKFGGIPAWILSRSLCVLTLPGLERNLRVQVDWILDVPFRNDIVVLAPQRTHKLGRAHYEPGDEVIRQGERGDCAYLILDGEVEVLRQSTGGWQPIARLKSGDCFGEIALLADIPRIATVRCLTPVHLVVLPRDQFMTLAEGYRELGRALTTRMAERRFQAERLAAAAETTTLT
jgi:NADH dehydrogenase FAD-containing subunit/uncharacterized membrane protein YphA (DoxX/SURF4 family)